MFTPVVIVEIVIALGLIILVHELGHFLTAKWFGVRVHRFALGMGPIIVKWQRGETEYSLRWIPIGGFVDLAGEHPSSEDGADPRGLCNKAWWQRVIVFSAGVFMNAVLAVVLFTVAPVVGIYVSAPTIGDVIKGMPAEKAGIKAGDRIVAINDEPVESFDDILNIIMAASAGSTHKVVVERTEPGQTEPKRITFDDIRSERKAGMPWPMIGITPSFEPVVEKVEPASPEEQAGLQKGDRILAVNGKEVTRWHEIVHALAEGPGGPVVLKIERKGKTEDLQIDPAKLKEYKWGMVPPVAVTSVEKGGPAARAGVEPRDRVTAINGNPWPTLDQLSDTIKSGETGSAVKLTLWRDYGLIDATCKTEILPEKPEMGLLARFWAWLSPPKKAPEKEPAKKEERPRIGVALGPATGDPVQVGNVEAGGAAEQAHLQPGDVILAAGEKGQRPEQWKDLVDAFMKAPDKPMLLQVRRGQSDLTVHYQPEAVPLKRFTMDQSAGAVVYVPLPRIVNPVKAIERGFKRAGEMTGRAYASIKQLGTGQVSTEMMAGPVGIVQLSFVIAAKGLGTFIDFWGILSVFIAVLNFLPLPPFDGGHVLFVLIDAVKGKPVSLKTRQVVWIVGWVLVGLLFVFVTFQDIRRVILGF